MELNREQYPALLATHQAAEPHATMGPVQFTSLMEKREGFAVVKNGVIIGAVTFSDLSPGQDIIVHASVHPDHQKRWLNRSVVEKLRSFIFDELELPRVTGYMIQGLTVHTGPLLLALGFRQEGHLRQAIRINGQPYDLILFGLLKAEWRF